MKNSLLHPVFLMVVNLLSFMPEYLQGIPFFMLPPVINFLLEMIARLWLLIRGETGEEVQFLEEVVQMMTIMEVQQGGHATTPVTLMAVGNMLSVQP